MARYVAIAKLPAVAVVPLAEVEQSSIPAICRSFFETPAATILVPRGAGIKRTVTEPHFPVTLQGTVCGFPSLLPQYPRRTGMMDSLAWMMAPLMAVATSLEHFTPNPT